MNQVRNLIVRSALPLLLLTLPVGSLAEQRSVAAGNMQAEDGDTLIVTIDDTTYKIQLNGIDAPEDTDNPKLKVDVSRTKLDKQELLALGRQATEHLRFLIAQDGPFKLLFNPAKKDRYGRTPGDIISTKGLSLSESMVQNGYAILSRRAASEGLIQRLQPLQQKARSEKRGLWGNNLEASEAWAGIKSSKPK